MFKIQRYEGKVVGIEIDGCKSIPPSMENTDFVEWRQQNPDVDLSDEPYDKPYGIKRKIDYSSQGVDSDAMIVALWEAQVEGRPEAMQALQAKRLDIKARHPKG
jgi:hypothetical protein